MSYFSCLATENAESMLNSRLQDGRDGNKFGASAVFLFAMKCAREMLSGVVIAVCALIRYRWRLGRHSEQLNYADFEVVL